MLLHQHDSFQLLCHSQATVPLALLSDSRPRYLWLPLHRPVPSATAAAATPVGQARRPRPELFQRSISDADKAGEVRLRLHWAAEEAPGDGSADALAIGLTLAGVALSLVEASVTRLPREVRNVLSHRCLRIKKSSRDKKHMPCCVPAHLHGFTALIKVSMTVCMPQVAHLSLEGVRGEVRRSGGSLAASVTVAGLQVDNQLVTSSRPVVLCATQQVPHLKCTLMQQEPETDMPNHIIAGAGRQCGRWHARWQHCPPVHRGALGAGSAQQLHPLPEACVAGCCGAHSSCCAASPELAET